MTVLAVTEDVFDTLLERHEIVFIDFWASWCAPCKAFAKIFESVSLQHADIIFASIDIDKEKALADAFAIQSVPALMVIKKGVVIYSESGLLPESALKELVVQAKSAQVEET